MLPVTRLFSGILLTFLICTQASCYTPGGLQKDSNKQKCIEASRQRITNATYNTKIDFYKKHFSGMLLFKAINDTDSRVVFVTETGFKIFDLEYTRTNFIVQYCLPPLRKKIILNIFKNDLGQLVQNDGALPLRINQKDSTITVTFAHGNNRYEDFISGPDCDQLTGIKRGGKYIKNVSTRISGMRKGNFDTIDIYHHPLKLHISLKQIER